MCRRSGCLPILLSLMVSGTAQHDLPAVKQILKDHLVLKHGKLYADKAYADATWAEALKKDRALELLTPRKKCKGDVLISGDTFSAFVSSICQPIECFFNWLNRLPNIQSACLVRVNANPKLSIFSKMKCNFLGNVTRALNSRGNGW